MSEGIKFRAWYKQDKKMYPVGAIDFDPASGLPYSAVLVSSWGIRADQLEIMQYTGRKDRKGVELYDGDIIKHAEGKVALVFWNKSAFCWDLKAISTEGTPIAFKKLWTIEFEIVGNIYENPELMKEERKV